MTAAGVATPEPILLVESDLPDGPSFFVTRRVGAALEVRQFFRRLEGREMPAFPEVEGPFLEQLGLFCRSLHDAGIWYRDLSMGNVLVQPGDGGRLEMLVVDCNRARVGARLGVVRRSRDICRFPIVERYHRAAFLRGYWGTVPSRLDPRWWLFTASVRGYLLKHALKNRLRAVSLSRFMRRSHHDHIPAAPADAAPRNKAVWIACPTSRISTPAAGRSSPSASPTRPSTRAIWRWWPDRCRGVAEIPQTPAGLYSTPAPFGGLGICLRPHRPTPTPCSTRGGRWACAGCWCASIRGRTITRRGAAGASWRRGRRSASRCRRTASWCRPGALAGGDREHRKGLPAYGAASRWAGTEPQQVGSLDLRRRDCALSRRGRDLAPDRTVELMARRSSTSSSTRPWRSSIGRSRAALRHPVEPALRDRRGAPENRQLGLDTVDKVVLLRAIAELGRASTERCWITEMNWPLSEGPHSPAGRSVSVDEDSQASFLVRYDLLTLGTGLVERVYWWQLVARGYGLMVAGADGSLTARPGYHALRELNRRLDGAIFHGPLPAPAGAYLYRFTRGDDEAVVGWSLDEPIETELPRPPDAAFDRDGAVMSARPGRRVTLGPSPTYFELGGRQVP
jgi:hypothetical protein